MHQSKRPLKLIVVPFLALLGSVAHPDDVRLGGARNVGMAGAGVALPVDVYENHWLNPALLGFSGSKMRYGVPYFGYHTDRMSVNKVNDLIGDTDEGGVSDTEVIKLARKYGNSTKEFGLNTGLGVSGGQFAFSARAEVVVRSVPNAQLKAFLKTGDDDFNNLPIDSRLDAYGLGAYQTGTSYGQMVVKGPNRLSLGATVRTVTAFYAHKVADADAIANEGDVRNGTEIAASDDVIQRSGVGLDLGALGTLKTLPDAYFGFNVQNLVEPNVKFVRTQPDTDFPLRRNLRPFRRQVNAGTAYVKDRYLLAADLVDLGNHTGQAGFRFGAEVSLNKYLAVRGGYDSRSNFVVGACVGGVNIAFSGNGTSSIVSAIRF